MQIFPGPSDLALHTGPWIGCEASSLARTLLKDLLRHASPRIHLAGPADSGKTFVLTDICRELGLQVHWCTSPEALPDSPACPMVVIESRTLTSLPTDLVGVDWPAPSVERRAALAQFWLDERQVRFDTAAIARLAELGQRGLSHVRGICQHAAHVAILNRARLTPTLVEEAAWAYSSHIAD